MKYVNCTSTYPFKINGGSVLGMADTYTNLSTPLAAAVVTAKALHSPLILCINWKIKLKIENRHRNRDIHINGNFDFDFVFDMD